MKLLRKIKQKINNVKLSYRIKKDNVKFIHLMFNDKFNKPFVDFLNSNFNSKEHLILCKKFFNQHPFPIGKNVIKIKRFEDIDLNKCEKIICHSLFDNELVEYLYNNKDILRKKAYWAIWGGDLYNAPRDEKNDFVRKNFKGYLSDFDAKYAQVKYNISNKRFYCIHAIFPITLEMIKSAKLSYKDCDCIKIQINNSCDKSTLGVLDNLAKFANEDIRICTILSYGDMKFKSEIIKKGKTIFGNKFEYIEEYMSPQNFANHLAKNDILILNQNRQQGVGNTIASIALNKKVFIKKEISTFSCLNDFGIKIFDSNEIANLTFKELTRNKYADISKDNALKFFNDKYKASLWREVFNAK